MAQIDVTVGDFAGNTREIVEAGIVEVEDVTESGIMDFQQLVSFWQL